MRYRGYRRRTTGEGRLEISSRKNFLPFGRVSSRAMTSCAFRGQENAGCRMMVRTPRSHKPNAVGTLEGKEKECSSDRDLVIEIRII